jgi:hypothetical protein
MSDIEQLVENYKAIVEKIDSMKAETKPLMDEKKLMEEQIKEHMQAECVPTLTANGFQFEIVVKAPKKEEESLSKEQVSHIVNHPKAFDAKTKKILESAFEKMFDILAENQEDEDQEEPVEKLKVKKSKVKKTRLVVSESHNVDEEE